MISSGPMANPETLRSSYVLRCRDGPQFLGNCKDFCVYWQGDCSAYFKALGVGLRCSHRWGSSLSCESTKWVCMNFSWPLCLLWCSRSVHTASFAVLPDSHKFSLCNWAWLYSPMVQIEAMCLILLRSLPILFTFLWLHPHCRIFKNLLLNYWQGDTQRKKEFTHFKG